VSISLEFLGEQVKALQTDLRSIKRDLAMLRAQQGELPTLAQFQSGLDSIDGRITETHLETMAAIQALTEQVKAKLP
jgi:prefoldin subunit 5